MFHLVTEVAAMAEQMEALQRELAEMREARAAAEAKAERENAAPACLSG